MPIFASVFLALDGASVPFLVIGGHAVVLHGHLRNTLEFPTFFAPSLSSSMPRATQLDEPPTPTGKT
jgi:hypothetical protein